jgi:hypothetical protein
MINLEIGMMVSINIAFRIHLTHDMFNNTMVMAYMLNFDYNLSHF